MTKNILIIPGGYPPLKFYGGTSISAKNLKDYLDTFTNVYILSRDLDWRFKKPIGDLNSNDKILFTNDFNLNFNFKFLYGYLRRNKIDTIILFGLLNIHVNFLRIIFFKIMRLNIIIAPHGELEKPLLNKFYKRFAIFIYKFSKILKDIKFHSTCSSESLQIRNLFNVNQSNIFEIENLPIQIDKNIMKTFNKNPLKLVFISRIHPKKNLKRIIEYLVKINHINFIFDIYGNIEDLKYWDSILSLIEGKNFISYKGSLEHKDIISTFSKYDFFIFLTKSENYGHVIVESLQAGTPVLLSRGTTPFDDLNNIAGYLIDEDFESFEKILSHVSNLNQNDYQEILNNTKKYLANKVNYQNIGMKYLKMLKIL